MGLLVFIVTCTPDAPTSAPRAASVVLSILSPLWFRPQPVEPVVPRGDAPPVPGSSRIRVLSWNVQFCAGRRCLFFYDGGPDARVVQAEVEHTLAGIAGVIRALSPDVVLLQEVDRCSARTARIDQHAELSRRLGYPVTASTPYFKVPFVPVPPANPMGRVDMHLSVFSRYALSGGARIALSPLAEPRWRRAFNLRRAILHTTLVREGGADLHLLNTHLSAFSRGDGTLDRQVDTLLRTARDLAGPLLLAGDLNSLPPGDDPTRLGRASLLYSDTTTPVAPLFDALQPVAPDPPLDPRWRSYVPWGSNLPDRTIDYAFGRSLVVDRAWVDARGAPWSDHLPIVADFLVDGSNGPG